MRERLICMEYVAKSVRVTMVAHTCTTLSAALLSRGAAFFTKVWLTTSVDSLVYSVVNINIACKSCSKRREAFVHFGPKSF